MDRVNQLRDGEAGSVASSPLSSCESSLAYVSATSDDTKYFSLVEADSTLDVTPLEDDSANPCDSVVSPSLHEPVNDLDSFKLGQTIEAANILSGGVNIFEDNDNSFDGNELVIDDNGGIDIDKKLDDVQKKGVVPVPESALVHNETDILSKETEVQLQIDGKSVDAIDIGNGLYLYRRDGEEELAAVQVFTEGEEPSYKFLKVRENAERNLEVYEEIEVEVTKSVPSKATKALKNTTSQGKNIAKPAGLSTEKKIIQHGSCTNEMETVKLAEKTNNPPAVPTECLPIKPATLETTQSPLRSGFLPMAFHSTPNKDGIPLTKTMVDQQLHPSRHSDNVKKTIEVNTENCKLKLQEKGKISTPSEDNTESSEQELKNISSLTQSADESDPPIAVTLSISNDENMIKDDQNETPPATKNHNRQSNQPTIHPTSVEWIQESKLDETKESKEAIIMMEKDSLAAELKSEVILEKAASPVENPKPKEKEAAIINTKPTEEDTTALKVSDSISEQSNVIISHVTHTEIQQTESRDTQTIALQNTSITTKKSKPAEDKEILLSDTEPKYGSNCVTNTPKVSDVSPDQSNVVTSQEKLSQNHQTEIKVIPTESSHGTAQKEQISSKQKNHLNKLDVSDIGHANKISNISECKEPEKYSVTQQLTLSENKLPYQSTLQKLTDKANENSREKTTAKTDPIPMQAPLTNAHSHKTNINTDSSKLSEPFIMSKVHLTDKKLAEIPVVKDDANNLSEELIQLTDLGVQVPKEALPDIIEKGFPDCLKSVADILKPKSYDSKRELSISQLNIKKESKIDIASIKATTLPKSDICISKSDGPKLVTANVIPITKVESLASVHDKRKSLLPAFNNKCEDPLISKYVNRAVIIKNNADSGNIQLTSVVKKNETVVKDIQTSTTSDLKPKLLNNNSAVPFGKWTEANKQAYLNKINEPKVISNPNQIKQAKDLNRRDILKKMDSQRQSFANYSRSLEVLRKANVKKEETVYAAKVIPKQETKTDLTVEQAKTKIKEKCAVPLVSPKTTKTQVDAPTNDSGLVVETSKNRKDFNNQDLIDKTIEDLMDKNLSSKPKTVSVDEVEKKMNDLHGIPFVERPVHELPTRYNQDLITYPKPCKRSTNLQVIKVADVPKLPSVAKPLDTVAKETIHLDEESEDEVLEHEPVTGDMQYATSHFDIEKVLKREPLAMPSVNDKKPSANVEKEINKIAPSSPVAYVDSIKDKRDTKPLQNANKTSSQKNSRISQYIAQTYPLSSTFKSPNFQPICTEESVNKTSPSKVQIAYTSAMTAKHNKVSPITVIEDRPVKVMYIDQGSSFIPASISIQDNELSSIKKITIAEEYPLKSYDTDRNASITKQDEQKKPQIKHQRKQVLTPVEEPFEIATAPDVKAADRNVTDKLKRATDETITSTDMSVIPKKTYLLDRLPVCEDFSKNISVSATSKNLIPISNAASAIDNLVKAAEMLENQQKIAESMESSSDSPQPTKRGRGRPRKYPLSTSDAEKPSTPSPQKKPRVARTKRISTSEEDESSSDDDMVIVNWTMGKINENIVCPICGKLFRSENVVFKHVKHCTGPSPNRSETSERKSSKRGRKRSGESDNTSMDTLDEKSLNKLPITSYKEREPCVEGEKSKPGLNDIIIIEDTPIKSKQKDEPVVKKEDLINDKVVSKIVNKTEPTTTKYCNIECDKCKKVFRQMSYYVKHKKEECKGQLKKEPPKRKITQDAFKSVFSCEVCKKDFRKLHHLVQHRMIHDPTTSRRRKSSLELVDKAKDVKATDDQSAGFRCEACDKSFRKLHHLVEHRETHDGHGKNKALAAPSQAVTEKSLTTLQCDVCNKTFRKLFHMIEHKEQHVNLKLEKTGEKNSKAAQATTDIIHECRLCYMVFPNEHSLNKHVGNCQKKKLKSIPKPGEGVMDSECVSFDDGTPETAATIPSGLENSVFASTIKKATYAEEDLVNTNIDGSKETLHKKVLTTDVTKTTTCNENNSNSTKSPVVNKQTQSASLNPIPLRRQSKDPNIKSSEVGKNKKPEVEETIIENMPNIIPESKPNMSVTITKRQKSTITPVVETDEVSDDDDVRYMLNPDFETEQAEAADIFMVKATSKRNSLQIDRSEPILSDALKRRTSLQHHSKLLKRNHADIIRRQNSRDKLFKFPKLHSESIKMNNSDSDDSDTKYAFPEVASKAAPKIEETAKKVIQRRSMNEKRKSLTGLAKKKAASIKVKPVAVAPQPKAAIKRRTLHPVLHKCDCGQIFNSDTLLSHHVTLSHTPPRRSRRRSLTPSPPRPPTLSKAKQTNAKDTPKAKKTSDPLKTNAKLTVTKTSSVTEATASKRLKKTNVPISSVDTTTRKRRKTGFHSGVPVPAKMKQLFNKQK